MIDFEENNLCVYLVCFYPVTEIMSGLSVTIQLCLWIFSLEYEQTRLYCELKLCYERRIKTT